MVALAVRLVQASFALAAESFAERLAAEGFAAALGADFASQKARKLLQTLKRSQ